MQIFYHIDEVPSFDRERVQQLVKKAAQAGKMVFVEYKTFNHEGEEFSAVGVETKTIKAVSEFCKGKDICPFIDPKRFLDPSEKAA